MRIVLAIDGKSRSFVDLNSEDLRSFEKPIRNRCGHFINISAGTVLLFTKLLKTSYEMSETADRTTQDLQLSWKHSIMPLQSHRALAQACIIYLYFSGFEFKDGGDSDTPSLGSEASDEDPCDSQDSMTVYDPRHWRAEYLQKQFRKYGLLDYTSNYWVVHHNLAEADPQYLEDTLFWRLRDPTSAFCKNWFELINQKDLGIEIFYLNQLKPNKEDSAILFCSFNGLAYGVKTLAKNTFSRDQSWSAEFAIEGRVEGTSINVIELIGHSGGLNIDLELLQIVQISQNFEDSPL